MKMKLKREHCMAVSYAALVLILVSLCGANFVHKVEAQSTNGTTTPPCNATTTAECKGEKKYITFDAKNKRGPFCNALIYLSCIQQSNAQNRPCTLYNFCDRGRHGSYGPGDAVAATSDQVL